jgi:hypothetical protein
MLFVSSSVLTSISEKTAFSGFSTMNVFELEQSKPFSDLNMLEVVVQRSVPLIKYSLHLGIVPLKKASILGLNYMQFVIRMVYFIHLI